MLLPRALGATTLALVAVGVVPPAHAASVTCDGLVATIVGTQASDRLVGTSGRDVIAGLAGNDSIDGRGGNDIICGGPGGDRLVGGPGNDRLLSGPPAGNGGDHFGPQDTLVGGPGDDTLVAAGPRPRKNAVVLSYVGAPRGVTVDLGAGTASGWGSDTILARTWVEVVGSSHDDVLTGSARADWLEGRAGDDTISGLAGDDRLDDGGGDDTVSGGPGDDDIMVAFGHDTAHGNGGNDSIFGFDWKADHVFGDAGDDVIDETVPVSADQEISGGSGSDRAFLRWRRLVSGKPAFTKVTTDMPAGTWTFTDQSVSFPLTGLERLEVDGKGRWTAIGTDGDDVYVTGWLTKLVASMGDGDDRVTGSNKADDLDGGAGTDTVKPFGGHDVCVGFERFPLGSCEETG